MGSITANNCILDAMPARCHGLMAYLCIVVGLWKKYKKIIWKKTIAIHNVFNEKTTKLNSQLAQYEKYKIDKDNFRKKPKKKEKKTMWGNTVAIHGVLKKKTTTLNSQPAQYEKNKIDKDNSEKKT